MIQNFLLRLAITADKLPHADPSSTTIQTVITFILGLTGAIALLIIIIASFRYVTSRGDSNTVKNAKDTIIYALVGLVITMAAYGIVTFVFRGVKR